MLDVSVSYNRYKFLGYEFLTWLWFLIEKDRNKLKELEPEISSLEIGNRIVLENNINDAGETVTIKGDDAGLEEGMLALKKGAVVTELNLSYKSDDQQEWRFTIKGESFNIANLKPPETGAIESKDDIEGAVLEKAYLYEKAVIFVDNVFKYFVKLRLSKDWNENIVPLVRQWIYS
ncbi:hypothetical protein [Desulfonema magnum]|uniref:Uncharacterized protein n=1 Tax=Desulfonema magnum TaxID=45655 RepID=A0A975BGI1_9BACT|nr:hypothetical protein [Desulfonema magnum]QTA84640.1 Uncharacterized protein dnm_006390 [Desulfonema magnum]